MEFIIVMVIIIAGTAIFRHYENPRITSKAEVLNSDEIDEEALFKIQNEFEKRVNDLLYAPGSFCFNDLYIYKNIMSPWFTKLSSKYRYNEVMTKRLRSDWLSYMTSLEDRSTSNFLSLESEDETESEEYRDEHISASKKVFAIENGFADLMGDDAMAVLEKARSLSFSDVDIHGNLAPEGKQFDAEGNLQERIP